MRVKCIHGYFLFFETKVGQVSDFMDMTGLSLLEKDDYYTFEKLEPALEYSLIGKSYLGINATKSFSGSPWKVFEENSFVYNYATDTVVLLNSITQQIKISLSGNRYLSPGLILPGSLTDDGKRVTGYSAWYSRDRGTWLYSEVNYV